jgi:hypothetical protein
MAIAVAASASSLAQAAAIMSLITIMNRPIIRAASIIQTIIMRRDIARFITALITGLPHGIAIMRGGGDMMDGGIAIMVGGTTGATGNKQRSGPG